MSVSNKKSIIYKLIRALLSPALSLLFLFFTFTSYSLYSQDEDELFEITVPLDVKEVGATEIDAIIKGREIYLAVAPLFDFLRIKNTVSPDMHEISGFFIGPDNKYYIDYNNNIIRFGNDNFQLSATDMILTAENLCLKANYLDRIFGLETEFNFRSLSVSITARLELPVIKEMRQTRIRNNLNRIKGNIQADTLYGKSHALYQGAMADWSLISTQTPDENTNTRANLRLGAMVAGGDLNVNLYYNSQVPLSEKQQYYLWRYVNNDNKIIRQVEAGKIFSNPVSTLFNPLVGLQFTNAPTNYRRSFGTYRLSDRTEPGWIVELYVNGVLVDYMKADASGFYSFDVPLVYGNTRIELKFYGPWGEEQLREQNFNIPFNFLPKKTLEYKSAAGFVQDGNMSRFSRTSVNYGLSERITLGTGFEYLSSLSANPFMPFASSSVRISNNMLLSALYVHRVKAGGSFSWRLPSNAQLDLKYNIYDKEQQAILYNYREERKATLSVPLHLGSLSSYTRLGVNQIVMPYAKYTTAVWMISGLIGRTNTNLTNYLIWSENSKPYIYSNMSVAFRLPAHLIIMPSAQYAFTGSDLITARIKAEKRFMEHAYMTLSAEKDFRNNIFLAEAGFRYNFNFARAGASARYSSGRPSFTQYASGSILHDRKNRFTKTTNLPAVGKGGIILRPFLDFNSNGSRDSDEEAAPGLNIRANSGKVYKSENDTLIVISGLQAYTRCFIELDPNSFYNIAWQLPLKTLNVMVDPDIMKTIDIPVEIAGEASGYINIKRDSTINSLGRVIVNFYSGDNKKIASTLSEQDGYYSYFGLKPGNYLVRPEPMQLSKLGFECKPDSLSFNIGALREGDIVYGLDFLLSEIPSASDSTQQSQQEQAVTRKDTTYMIIHELTQELLTIKEDCWAIQLGAFTQKGNADRLRKRLQSLLKKDVEIVTEGDFYKVRILELKDRKEVDKNLDILSSHGFNEFWIIKLKAMQQQVLIKEVRDSIAMINETIIEPGYEELNTAMSMQVGAFRNRNNALALVDRLSVTLDKKLLIIPEDGYYKVRIAGFESIAEMERMIPSLGIQGVNDIWILPEGETKPQISKEPTDVMETGDSLITEHTDEIKTDKIKADSLKAFETDDLIQEHDTLVSNKQPVPDKPKVKLLVGTFSKRTQALKAKRRIENKLKLEVEIVEQWDYYRVLVTGFYSKEETYSYYPELAGLGYDVISLIDESDQQ